MVFNDEQKSLNALYDHVNHNSRVAWKVFGSKFLANKNHLSLKFFDWKLVCLTVNILENKNNVLFTT